MQLDTLPRYLFTKGYARYSPEKKRRLTREESFRQVMDMHRRQVKKLGADRLLPELDDIEQAMLDGELLGSQRALQYGGTPMERHNEKGYNCTFSLCDRPRFFGEGFFLLLCGAGVGFSVQRQHVAMLPPLVGPSDKYEIHVVEDSIEGWADAAQALLDSYFYGLPFPMFDYSRVRPRGAPISTGVGKAPGPEPLANALKKVQAILEKQRGLQLRPIDAYDIFMHLADAVISGGVRRSATLALCSLDDDLMVNAKTGNWFEENPQRARSNNSVAVLRATISKEQLQAVLMPSQEAMGDLGVYFTDDLDIGCNPCGEISFKPLLEVDGEEITGWVFCNLCEINATKIKSVQDGLRLAHLASVLGTIQATYTDFPYLGEVSEQLARRDALLGVSMTGIMDNPQVMNEYLLQVMARQVVATNEVVARELGINPAARTTCIKPAGKTSLQFGTSSGAHRRKGPRTLRRVQATALEAPSEFLVERLLEYGGLDGMVEPGAWGTDYCFTFPEVAPEGALFESDASAVKQLEEVKFLKDFWVNPGHNEGEETHNVSNTIFVEHHEWEDVLSFVWEHKDSFGGVSFQRASSALDYPQAPTVAVDDLNDLVAEYGRVWVDVAMSRWYDRPTGQTVWQFKEANANPEISKLEDLHHRVALYCVYDELLHADFSIDFTQLVEEEDNTQLAEMLACSGGSCEF